MRLTAFLRLLPLALILAAGLLSSCQPGQGSDRLEVAVSVLPQAELVQALGGDRVKVLVMVPPGANPHTYEPKPADLAELSRAAAYAKVGAGIEFELAWMDKLIGVNPHMKIIDCARGIELQREDGGGIDPHIWVSPANAETMVRNIADGLIELDPTSRARYERNRDLYLDRLGNLGKEIWGRLSGVTNRRFIIYHPVLGYFASEYDLEQIAIEEEGKEPTAARIAEVVDMARKYNLKAIFTTPQQSSRSAETIAQSIGGRVVLVDYLAQDYIESMRDNTEKLAAAMEGK